MKTLNNFLVTSVLLCVSVFAMNTYAADAYDTQSNASQSSSSTGQAVDDSAITAKVKTKLLADKRTHATKIKVVTTDGVVTLSGHVTTSTEKDAAEEVAKATDGVKNVTNNLDVTAKS